MPTPCQGGVEQPAEAGCLTVNRGLKPVGLKPADLSPDIVSTNLRSGVPPRGIYAQCLSALRFPVRQPAPQVDGLRLVLRSGGSSASRFNPRLTVRQPAPRVGVGRMDLRVRG